MIDFSRSPAVSGRDRGPNPERTSEQSRDRNHGASRGRRDGDRGVDVPGAVPPVVPDAASDMVPSVGTDTQDGVTGRGRTTPSQQTSPGSTGHHPGERTPDRPLRGGVTAGGQDTPSAPPRGVPVPKTAGIDRPGQQTSSVTSTVTGAVDTFATSGSSGGTDEERRRRREQRERVRLAQVRGETGTAVPSAGQPSGVSGVSTAPGAPGTPGVDVTGGRRQTGRPPVRRADLTAGKTFDRALDRALRSVNADRVAGSLGDARGNRRGGISGGRTGGGSVDREM